MKKHEQDEQVRKAKAALKRVEQESEKILGAGTFDDPSDDNDPIVVLGKKIGRAIGYVIVVILIWHLATTYFIK